RFVAVPLHASRIGRHEAYRPDLGRSGRLSVSGPRRRFGMIRSRHLRMAWRFGIGRFREVHPVDVQATLLNACNLRCVYCRCPEVKTAVMTTEEWLHAIAGLASLGMIRIKFQGGEPTMRQDFNDLAAAARSHGVVTATITNGVLIPERPSLLD